MATSTIVRVTRSFACTAESVYDAWLEPERARRFLFTVPLRGEVVRCEIEPGIGGSFTITDRRSLDGGAIEIEHAGRYLQLDRPRRIGFSFSVPQFNPRETTVVIDIEPQGDGCALTLRHDLGADAGAEAAERTEQGWANTLLNLERALQNQ